LSRSSSVGGSNGQTIRGALIDLIKFYVGRDVKFDELSCILGCICAIQDEIVVCIIAGVFSSTVMKTEIDVDCVKLISIIMTSTTTK